MAVYQAPLRQMRFLLHEVFNVEKTLGDISAYPDFNQELMDAILDEAANFATQVLLPINASGDLEGCKWQDGEVTTPEGFKEAFKQFCDSGWSAMGCDENYGGQPIPKILHLMVEEIFCACNTAFELYPNLTNTAIFLLEKHANQELKDKYLAKMITGEWMGTMCLTESHAGSDLGIIKTTAVPNGDDSYNLNGTKIFISAGEHDLSDNIIHLVLAKLPDSPPGSKGISLFLVPKINSDEAGNLTDSNGVSCGSIEHKMGIKGSATCVINFDDAKGYLIGEPNQGLRCMFTMMNAERLSVGVQAIGMAETSSQSAVAYALDRKQGRVSGGPEDVDSIVKHGDVRRMLLSMMTMTSGCRALSAYVGLQYDISDNHPDADERKRAAALVALLTPVCKAFVSDRGLDTCNNGIQVLGGHGYVQEWGMEQLVRDTRITQIYEGTNGIQALDLLGRKILSDKGAAWKELYCEMSGMLEAAEKAGFEPELCAEVRAELDELDSVTMQVFGKANMDFVSSVAADYMNLFGTTIIACLWLKVAATASQKAEQGTFETQLQNQAKFFCTYHLASNTSARKRVLAGADATMAMTEAEFELLTEVN
ncbi:MAG: acyl-CoA dehydrogenase family protein [Gammaproteobacteria bacterium]|nr:acyl-CoA dehydrogenase family protein [Gammaproteobacteria bacterium]NNJ71699.1 acyl-CoA dehydrogenase [Enterobacterales bacterium]